MKDRLTPNLPQGWKHWAESGESQLFGLGVLIALSLYFSVRMARSSDYNRKEKQVWIIMLWLFPVVSHVLYLHHSWQTRKARLAAKPTMAEGGIENDKAQDS